MLNLMNIHGTYPWDSPGLWKHARTDGCSAIPLTHEEAAELVNAPADIRKREYMWLNKGFIVLDLLEGGNEGADGFGFALTEQLTDGMVGGKGVEPGMKAIYLGDGEYYLLEAMDPFDAFEWKCDGCEKPLGKEEFCVDSTCVECKAPARLYFKGGRHVRATDRHVKFHRWRDRKLGLCKTCPPPYEPEQTEAKGTTETESWICSCCGEKTTKLLTCTACGRYPDCEH